MQYATNSVLPVQRKHHAYCPFETIGAAQGLVALKLSSWPVAGAVRRLARLEEQLLLTFAAIPYAIPYKAVRRYKNIRVRRI